MPTYLITGANRGLGLEFVRQLSQNPSNTIIATTRAGADTSDLKAASSKATHILECDISSPPSITTLATELSKNLITGNDDGQGRLDFVIANAGVNSVPHQTCLDIGREDLHREIDINVLGPANLTTTLLTHNLLAPKVRIMNMTSGLGSMSRSLGINPRKCATYSISKAGLNMLTVHQSGALREKMGDGVVVICMDPGWVKTRMGGDGAILEPVSLIDSSTRISWRSPILPDRMGRVSR